MSKRKNIIRLFEQGVNDYFKACRDCLAHEKPHQLWLGISLARHIPMHRLLSEYDVPKKDVLINTPLKITRGVIAFDLCVARDDTINAQKFWTRFQTRRNDNTAAATLTALQQVCIIAELKTSSIATTKSGLKADLFKMCGAMKFMKRHKATKFPRCYLLVFDPKGKLPVDAAYEEVMGKWPKGVPKPRVMRGP